VKARAHYHACRTEHQRGCDATPIGDAARRYDRDVAPGSRNRVHHRRNQREGRPSCTVAARLASLRDDDVGTLPEHLARLGKRVDLTNHRNA